jgi:hypothetical protein
LAQDYQFSTKEVYLNDTKKAQLQVIKTLAEFTYEHDDKETLLIVYYAGHGVILRDESQDLYLSG